MSTYCAVRRPGRESWFKACVEHMEAPQIEWNAETLKIELQKFRVRKYWDLTQSHINQAALRNGISKLIDNHFNMCEMELTIKHCKTSAKQASTVKQWSDDDPELYLFALINEWDVECTTHLPSPYYPNWQEFFIQDPLRFLHIFTNRKWEEAVWLGLERPLGRNKKKAILEDWTQETIEKLRGWGTTGQEMTRKRFVRVVAPKSAVTIPLPNLSDSELGNPFREARSIGKISMWRKQYMKVFGCDRAFRIVMNSIEESIVPQDLDASDEIIKYAFSLIQKYRPNLFLVSSRLGYHINVSIRLKTIFTSLKAESTL